LNKYKTYKEEHNSFRNESNPNPNFFNKLFDNQSKNPFDKKGSMKEVKLEKSINNYLKKNLKKISGQRSNNPGHHRSQSMNVLY